MAMHSFWKNGNLVYYAPSTARWLDAIGPDVCKHLDDFVATPVDDTTGLPTAYTCTLVNASTAALTGQAGGALLITTAGAENDGVSMQLKGESFKLASGKPLYFGAKFKISDATQSDFLVGLCITDTALLGGMTDGVYFRKVDGSTDVNFVLEKNSTETSTAAAILTADTSYHILEFLFDGSSITYYVDGVEGSETLVTTNLPDDEELTVSVEFLTGAAAAITMTVDWVHCIQINA